MSIFDFIRKKAHRPETINVTPEWISELQSDEIFVFGCRRSGRHYEGAANFARVHFGAIVGPGEGLQGQSYASQQPESVLAGFVVPLIALPNLQRQIRIRNSL